MQKTPTNDTGVVEQIRPRTAADIEACVGTLRLVHLESGYPLNWPERPNHWLHPAGLLEAWVAADESDVLGHIALTAGSSYPELLAAADCSADGFASISQLFVRPSARGRRLGERLIAVATEFAGSHEWQVGLEVVDQPGSSAVALYERLGWRLIGACAAEWTAPDGNRPPLRLYLTP